MAFGLQDMRAFASEWLEELLRVGYYGMEASLGLPLKQRSRDFFAPPKPLLLYGKAYPTRIAETGQTIWIWLDGPHSPERGYLLMLLRYHRPGFDDLPIEDRANRVADTCAHVNEFLEALRKLV